MFYQTCTARKPPSACTPVTPSSPAATQWSRLLLDDVIFSVCRTWCLTMHCQWGGKPPLVTLTFDIWPWHSNSSERGWNTCSLWIWRKSVQPFPRYFRHKQNKQQTRMWANAQRDGRPAEYRWRPLFNAAKYLADVH